MMDEQRIWIGVDRRELDAVRVTERSIEECAGRPLAIEGLHLPDLQARGLYTRELDRLADGTYYDPVSDAPMSTEFAISRFLVPLLQRSGWAVFVDCDVLFRTDPAELFALADPRFAVQVVKHRHRPDVDAAPRKMDGQHQTFYARKNWSSVMLINCAHPGSQRLTGAMVNGLPGRDLHAFSWLHDSEIGALPPSWNYLVGVNARPERVDLAHFTLGIPSMPGHDDDEFADEWFATLARSSAEA